MAKKALICFVFGEAVSNGAISCWVFLFVRVCVCAHFTKLGYMKNTSEKLLKNTYFWASSLEVLIKFVKVEIIKLKRSLWFGLSHSCHYGD